MPTPASCGRWVRQSSITTELSASAADGLPCVGSPSPESGLLSVLVPFLGCLARVLTSAASDSFRLACQQAKSGGNHLTAIWLSCGSRKRRRDRYLS